MTTQMAIQNGEQHLALQLPPALGEAQLTAAAAMTISNSWQQVLESANGKESVWLTVVSYSAKVPPRISAPTLHLGKSSGQEHQNYCRCKQHQVGALARHHNRLDGRTGLIASSPKHSAALL